MQTLEWKRRLPTDWLKGPVIADLTPLSQHYCPACHSLLQEKRIEVIADFGAWHLGWRRYACTRCPIQGSRLVLTRETYNLEYQTHPVLPKSNWDKMAFD